MNSQPLPKPVEAYLGLLKHSLADVPAAQQAALDDVTAHITEAMDSGQPVDVALASFGPAEAIAAQYREELGLPARAPSTRGSGATALHIAAVVVAVLVGVVNVYFEAATGGLSLGAAVLLVIPALLAALPLVLPTVLRVPVALANAVVVTGFSVATFAGVGAFFVPLAFQLWAAVLVPWQVAHGRTLERAPVWRTLGAVTVALPGVLVFAGMVTGTLLWHPVAVGVAGAVVVLAVCFAAGLRGAAPVIACLGLLLLIAVFFSPGMLLLGLWWVGGYFLALGLGAMVSWSSTPKRQPLG